MMRGLVCGGASCGIDPFEEVKEVQEDNRARTDDGNKLPLAWLPWAALRAVSRVQAFGHKKYNDFNNYRKGMEVTRNASCALRHITEYLDGNTTDPESGEHHLAHAICRLAFILQNEAEGTAIDDRYKSR